MTLDIAKFISNSIKTQAKIQHLDINTKTTTTNGIPESVSKIIFKDYGKKYLLDADYVSFFWGAISKDEIKKLFNVVDKALGKSANKLTETDFKKISIESSDDSDEVEDEETEIEDIEDDNDDNEVEDDEEVEVDDDNEEDNNDVEDDEESDDEDELNEDEEIDIEVDQEQKPTAYFFLKITLK